MTEEKRTVKSYKTLWKMHIWGYTGDKMIFLTSLLFIVVGILMKWIFISAVGVGFMWYHLRTSMYWWKKENRMMDYYMNKGFHTIESVADKRIRLGDDL